MVLIITMLPVVTKDLPISPRRLKSESNGRIKITVIFHLKYKGRMFYKRLVTLHKNQGSRLEMKDLSISPRAVEKDNPTVASKHNGHIS